MDFKKDFTIVPLLSPDSRVHIFRSSFSAPGEFETMTVDSYAIVTESSVVICDTLLCPQDMERVCTWLGSSLLGRQLLVINSHADWDHVWGNDYLDQHYTPTFIGHQRCRSRLLSPQEAENLRVYQEKFAVFRPVVLLPPTLTFHDSLTLYGGDLTLELFAAPGHQYDHIAIWIPELSLLLAFDALESPFPSLGSPDLVPAMFATLQYFQQLEPSCILCSHGNTDSPTLIEQNLSYLREIERRCRALLAQSPVLEEQLSAPSSLIGYPYTEAIAHVHTSIDHTYYSDTHEENIRFMLRWLLNQKEGELSIEH